MVKVVSTDSLPSSALTDDCYGTHTVATDHEKQQEDSRAEAYAVRKETQEAVRKSSTKLL